MATGRAVPSHAARAERGSAAIECAGCERCEWAATDGASVGTNTVGPTCADAAVEARSPVQHSSVGVGHSHDWVHMGVGDCVVTTQGCSV